MENNKLIAEFMGSNLNGLESWQYEDELKYHTSWDWLMPVVQKCFEVAKHEDDFSVIIWSLPYMDTTYDEVVEFIKQYNNE